MSYLPEVAWSTIASNVTLGASAYRYYITVNPLDPNEAGASPMTVAINDWFIDFAGYPFLIEEVNGSILTVYDILERGDGVVSAYAPYANKLGYVYRPLNGAIILTQAQLRKLDESAKDVIQPIEKGIIYSQLLQLNQINPQTIINGIPLTDWELSDFNNSAQLVNKEYVDSTLGIIQTYFFNNTISDIGGIYYYMLDEQTGESEATFVSGSLPQGNNQPLVNFITELNSPGTTIIKSGIYQAHIHAKKASSGDKPVKIHYSIYNRTLTGIETLIATSELSDYLTTSNEGYLLHTSVVEDITVLTTDRRVIKWVADVEATGIDAVVTLYVEGANASRLEIPTTTEILSTIFLRQDGTKNGALVEAQTFTNGVELSNLIQGYIPYAYGTSKLLNNSPIFIDGVNIGFGTTTPQTSFHFYESTTAEICRFQNTDTILKIGFDLYCGEVGIYTSDDTLIAGHVIENTDTIMLGQHILYAVNSTQRIGIKTATPEYDFDLNGTARIGTLNGLLLGTSGVLSATSSLGITYGGTGITSYTQGDLLYYTSGDSLSKLNKSTSTNYYLKNSGVDNSPAWASITDSDLVLSDITTNNASSSKHGFLPKLPNDTSKWLRGDGSWATISTDYGSFLDSVIRMVVDNSFDPSPTTTGDRYILETTSLHTNFGTITGLGVHDIVQYNGSAFTVVFDASAAASPATVTVGIDINGASNHDWTYNVTDDIWVDRGTTTLHNSLSDLNTGVGQYYHLTSEQHDLVAGITSTFTELNYLDGTTVTSGRILFGDGTKITNDSNLYWDYTNDRLSIGTTTPVYKFEVSGTGASPAHVGIIATDTSATYIRFGYSGEYNAGIAYQSTATGFLSLRTGGHTASEDRLVIKDTGISYFTNRLGIKRTLPIYDLDVNGTTRIGTLNGLIKGTSGVLSAITSTESGTKYLRDDYTWQTVTESYWSQNGTSIYYNTGNVGIGTSSPGAKLDIAGTFLVNRDAVAYYYNLIHKYGGSSKTGTLKITLPKGWSSTMMKIKIEGFEYSGGARGQSWSVNVGGYNYLTNPAWHNYFAEINGAAKFSNVRLGYDGTRNVILLGTTTSTWSYSNIAVTEMMASYSNTTGWDTGWSIDWITDETGITNIATPAIDLFRDSSGNIGINNTTPSYKLDVNGTGNFATSLKVGTLSGLIKGTGGVLSAITGTQGDIIYYNGTNWVTLAAGTNGYFLKTQGSGANPVWSAVSGGTVTSVAAGNGMNFTTITSSGSVTLGTPSALTSITTNSVTSNSHTHSIEIAHQTSTTSSSTPTPTGNYKENEYYLTALAAGATFAAPSGTPVNGNTLLIRIKDNGTARTLAWNSIYRAVGVTLPTTTTASKTLYIGCIYNSTDSKWDVVSVVKQA